MLVIGVVKRKTIEEAARRRIEGITGKGPVWEKESKAADPAYKSEFGPVLADQNACGEEVERLSGYAALVAYASCMQGKRGSS